MRRITLLALAIIFAGTLALPGGAEAQTYYYPTTASSYSSSAALQLQQLYAQLLDLQRQLAALTQNCTYLGTCANTYTGPGLTTVSSVDVEFVEDEYAEISIRYNDGDRDEFLLDAETESEVIDFLVSETDNARAHLVAVTDFSDSDDDDRDNDDDLRSIDVEIRNGDAHVDVRFDDGDRDSFTIRNETNHGDIIEEIADELDVDEDDVEDIIDFDNNGNNDDVDSIDVTVDEDDDEATARVHFEDGDTTTYHFSTADEDDIIEELADLLDMDENDVEDVTDFEFNDNGNDDVDEIDVTIFEDDEEAEAVVRFDDGDRVTYFFDTDDEDDIIEDLADILDMDEDDVEDIIDFEYED